MSDFCKQKFVLDSLIVDPDANTINRRGAEKRLEPKVMALLCLFANNFGQVVSREQITAEIWADVIVGEESITRAIFALRNALGDDAKQPKFIETIPKKGYRLLVEPKLINLDIAKSAPARKPTRKIVAILLSGGIAILLIVATFLRWPIATAFFGQYSTGNLSSDIDKILPVTKLVGSEGDMAILAAKQTMVFVHATGVTSNLFTRDLKSGMETQITNDDWIKSSPIWIDGATLGYIRCKSNQCEIVTQHKQQQPEVLYSSFKPIFTLSFSMDAPETLIFIEYQSNELNELKSLNLRNGKRENFRDIYPHLPKKIFLAKYSHDSQLILVSVDAERPLLQKINLFTKKINLVSAEFEEIKSIDVAGQQLLVAGTLQSTHGVWLISEDKSAKLVLRASGGEEILDAVSDAEAGVIYYQNYQINIDTNLINANGNVNELDALNSSGNETNAVFSQDEKEIYFVSNRTGYAELWNYDIHTKRVKQITDLKALSIIGPIISHDQTRFVLEYRTDNLYIGIFDKDTGKLIVNSQIPSHRFPLSWSRDNNYIYVSEHEAQVNLFRYNVSNLEFSVVAKNAGLFARESMDGKKLVYVDYDSGGLIEYELVNKSSASLGSLIENLAALSPGQFRLSKDWTAMYVLRNDHNTPHLLSKSLMPTGTRSDIRTIELPELAWVTDINNTGTQILFLQHKPPSGDIMKIELR